MTCKVFPAYRTLALFALALVTGLLMQSISTPIHSNAASAHQNALHVIEHDINYTIVDNGVPGDSPGDLLIFANPIYDSSDRVAVGRDSGSCIRTIIGVAYECNWTVFLPNGQLTVEGPYYDHADSMVAIIGGTGAYSHARGQMLLHARDLAGTEYDYTYYMN
jgi:Allene oxide cyclase